MKNIFKVIICLLFLSCVNVNATSFSMNLSGNTSVKVGEEVNISISLNNISGIPNGLNACQATLTSSGLSINSIVGNGWNVTNGSVLIMDSSNSITNSGTIATIKATVNSAGSITISNIMCSDGENEYNASNRTINFTIKKEGQTTTKRVETSKTTTKQTNSSLLKSLTIDGIELEFNKNTYDYTIEVENNIDKLILNYKAENKNAKVEKIGNEELVVGENKIELIVVNENSKNTYTLNIIRKDKLTEVSNNEADILEALKQNINILKIKVDINDNSKIITSDILKYLKENNKNIMYEVYKNNKIVYSIKILGKNVNDFNEFNLNIRFKSNYNNTIKEQLKNNNYTIINFDYRGELPKDTEVTLYNLNFSEKKLNLYDYNENKDSIEYKYEIKNKDKIVLKIDKTSEYVLTNYRNSQTKTIVIISFISLTLLFIILTSIIVFKSIKRKKAYKF